LSNVSSTGLDGSSHSGITDHLYGQDTIMKQVDLAEAKAHLSEFVAQAAAGEPVCIMPPGKPVAQLTTVDVRRKRIDLSALRAMTDAMPAQPERARDFVRRMRDEARY
jgi:prevent-host-death family protein